MLRVAFISLVLTLAFGGCGLTPIEPDAGPSGPDGMVGDIDGGPSASVLRFVFTSNPTIPGDAGGREAAQVDTVELELVEVRAISDNASPTEPTLELDWGDPYDAPQIFLDFDDAAPGIYSRLRAQLVSISITGSVTVGEQDYDYVISGAPQAESVAVDLTMAVLSGTSVTTVPIEIDLESAIREVNWTALAPTAMGKTIVLPEPLFDEFAEHLAEAFGQDE